LLAAIILVLRIVTLTNNELSWDIFGYYLYLPPHLHPSRSLPARHRVDSTR
jgi:hypothetical protein